VIDSSAKLIARVSYAPYVEARHHWFEDVDGDGDHDTADLNLVRTLNGKGIQDVGYRAEADLDRDGQISRRDYGLANSSDPTGIGFGHAALAEGVLSASGSGEVDNVIGWDGYVFNAEVETYTVRFRTYSPELGRWFKRDPAGHVDGMHLYQYARGRPCTWLDPFGLLCDDECEEGDLSTPQLFEVRLRPYLRHAKPRTIDAGVCAIRGAQLVQLISDLGGVGRLVLSVRSASITCGKNIAKLKTELEKLLGMYILEEGASEAVSCLGIDPDDAIEQLLAFDFTLMELEGAAVWLKVRWKQCEERCCCLVFTQRKWVEKEDWITCMQRGDMGGGIDPGDANAINAAVNDCIASFTQLFNTLTTKGDGAQCVIDDWNRNIRGCYSDEYLKE